MGNTHSQGATGDSGETMSKPPSDKLPVRYEYQRPVFLEITQEEADSSKDHGLRNILNPHDVNRMPWHSGYAETINAGKSHFNEDQASVHVASLTHHNQDDETTTKLPYVMFSIFDGHRSPDTALMAANMLHHHVREKLDSIRHFLAGETANIVTEDDPGKGRVADPIPNEKLVAGALEEAFAEMDEQILSERDTFQIKGGCTVIAALFLQNKLFVANAGDCRAIILSENHQKITEMSMDFTPETDRRRLQALAYMQPELLGKYFGRIVFQRRLKKEDVGQRVLYSDVHMSGWAYRVVNEDDVSRVPMIVGHGKRARLMATIGTTRGFGDHDLKAPGDQWIKPFLTPTPEVRVHDLSSMSYKEGDILIVASDGLWERLTNEEAQEVVLETFEKHPHNEKIYTQVAHDLILAARGTKTDEGWRTKNDDAGSADDITVFVIPLHCFHTAPTAGCHGEYQDNLPPDTSQSNGDPVSS